MRVLKFGVAAFLLTSTATAWSHPHQVITPGNDGQVIANGQNHPAFLSGVSCATDDWDDPAWYGLESAHHGPDAGDPGKGDDCYMTTGGVAPGSDVQNPVIR